MTDATQTLELMRLLPALSIRQPWPWYIIRPDLQNPTDRFAARQKDLLKTVENRDWRLANPGRKFRGRFLIHAGLGPRNPLEAEEEHEDAALFAALRGVEIDPVFSELQRGGIVGVATVVDFVTSHPSNWFTGPGALVLEDAEPLPFVPCRGMLGFFHPEVAA